MSHEDSRGLNSGSLFQRSATTNRRLKLLLWGDSGAGKSNLSWLAFEFQKVGQECGIGSKAKSASSGGRQ